MSAVHPVYQIGSGQLSDLCVPSRTIEKLLRLRVSGIDRSYCVVGCIFYFGGERRDIAVYKTGTYEEVQNFVTRYYIKDGEQVFSCANAVDVVEIWHVVPGDCDCSFCCCDCCGRDLSKSERYDMANGQIWCEECVEEDSGLYEPPFSGIPQWLIDAVGLGNALCGGEHDVEYKPVESGYSADNPF